MHIFSLEYMKGDIRFTHYFAVLCLFTAGMLNLVVAENTIQLLLGWEIMGLCSFMLIGHWWEEKQELRRRPQGVLHHPHRRHRPPGRHLDPVLRAAGSFSILAINALGAVGRRPPSTVLFWAAIALFIAIIGKSGQFPLHTWLPDAMAGPTPVSALIHAATMVVAGVYLGARLYPVFWEGFEIGDGRSTRWRSSAASPSSSPRVLAFVQVDIKKVLAYSTVSQLGYMVMGLGVGAWTAAVFHIFTHAFFKALLFLGAGSVSHSGSHHSFDMKKDMGGLRQVHADHLLDLHHRHAGAARVLPARPASGRRTRSSPTPATTATPRSWSSASIGAFLTAAYMTRCIYLTFFGEYRGGHHEPDVVSSATSPSARTIDARGRPAGGARRSRHGGRRCASGGHDAARRPRSGRRRRCPWRRRHGHDDHHAEPHESPLLITVPLMILAVLSITVGLAEHAVGRCSRSRSSPSGSSRTAAFPELEHAPFSAGLAVLSVGLVVLAVAVGGLALPAQLRHVPRADPSAARLAGAGYTFLGNKYYLDDLYENVIVAGIKRAHRQGRATGSTRR